MAPPSVDAAISSDPSRPPEYEPGDSYPRQADGHGESASMRTAVVRSARCFQYSMASLPRLSKLRQMGSPDGRPSPRCVLATPDHCSTRHGRLSNPELAAASSCRVDCPATYFYPCRLMGRSPHLFCALRASSSL